MVCALHWDAPLRSFRSLFTSLVISSSSQFVQLIHCRLRLMTLVVLRDGLSMLRMFMFMTARLPGATNPSRNLSTCQHFHTSTLAPMWQRQSVKDTSGRTSRYTHEERANTGPKKPLTWRFTAATGSSLPTNGHEPHCRNKVFRKRCSRGRVALPNDGYAAEPTTWTGGALGLGQTRPAG